MTKNMKLICLLLIACIHIIACTPADSPPENEKTPAAIAQDENAIDLIIEGDYVVTMDDDGNVIADGALAIDGGLIIAMGTADDINARFTANGHLPGDKHIVMPGLVNGHSHAAMTLLRGVADDLGLLDWLRKWSLLIRSSSASGLNLPAGK
jgi:5-methylthioadenosine/S-adenosylhomocysteine deaminase